MAIESTEKQQSQPISSTTTTSSHSSSLTITKEEKKFHSITEYQDALKNFSVEPKENQPTESTSSSSCCSTNDPLVDEYFDFIAYTGRTGFQWDLIRPAFLWKLQTVINNMHMIEAESQADDFLKEQLINNAEIKETREFIMEKANSFDGIPFTIQRLCELLTQPTKHYHNTAVFLRALEKNINVVSTITKDGYRVTGVHESEAMMDEEDGPVQVERNFIVSVDEVDEPLPKKVAMQQHQNGNLNSEISKDCGPANESRKTSINSLLGNKDEEQKQEIMEKEETETENHHHIEQQDVEMKEKWYDISQMFWG